MDGFLQRIFDMINHRMLMNMPPEGRARKLALVNSLAGNGKSDKEVEKSTRLNNLRAMIFKRRDDKSTGRGGRDCEENGNVIQGYWVTSRNESNRPLSVANAEEVETFKQDVKRSRSVPAEVHNARREAATVEESGNRDLPQNLLTIPSLSVTNLLEEIEADLPSSYSLANVLDHTPYTVTNLRTWARLSRVGMNFQQVEKAENSPKAVPNHANKIKELQKEAFIQKTLMDQAEKAVSLCKVRKKDLDVDDIEGVRALLMAKLRYDILCVELQKLTFSGGEESRDETFGELEISDVSFPVNNSEQPESDSFVFVAYHRDKLFGSQVQREITDGTLNFPVKFRFNYLQPNFIIHLELYKLDFGSKAKKSGKKGFELKNFMKKTGGNSNGTKGESRDFECIGTGSLRLTDLKCREKGKISVLFQPNYQSAFGKTVSLKLKTRLFLNSKINGFLDFFKDCCWHRFWCCPVGYALQFWLYPEDKENGKAPVETVLLPYCRENIQRVNMDVCVRPYSFTITYKKKEKAILLSATSRKDMMNWINFLRSAVRSFEAWAPDL